MQQYEAPKLTKYGKVENFIQAGSIVATGDLTGDGVADAAFDTNGDGKADEVVGGVSGNITNVTFQFNASQLNSIVDLSADFYDSDGDMIPDFAIADSASGNLYLQNIGTPVSYYGFNLAADVIQLDKLGYFISPGIGTNTEVSSEGGWDDPARD